MAKIKKIEVRKQGDYVNNSRGLIVFVTFIEYAQKTFFIRLPEEWQIMKDHFEEKGSIMYFHGRSRGWCFHADTEEQVERIFFECANEFYTANEKKTKVILYKFSYKTANIFSCKKGTNWGSDTTEGEIELSFDYRVLTKQEVGQAVQYLDDKGRQVDRSTINESANETAGDSAWVEINHTEEAEEFFKSVYSGFEGIMKKMKSFIGTKKALIKTLESKQKLLK